MNGTTVRSMEHNLLSVRARLAEAALRSGRAPEAVTLVAVTKTLPAAAAVSAYLAGVRNFGENRVEEGLAKIPAVHSALAGQKPVWHMVGHVQSRKARDVAGTFDVVQSVDSVRAARRLGCFAVELGRTPSVFLECNVSGESAKYGFAADRWRDDDVQRSQLFATVEEIVALPGIRVEGLMTMAPSVPEAEEVRPVFVRLRDLLHELRDRFPQTAWRHLSMGMTDDFEIAVEEGATMVRIGRAIFGSRPR